jgi:hypothetical protein
MTLPTIFPSQYDGTIKDFLKVKADRSGAARIVSDSVSVASGTVATTIIGLFPFNKGCRVHLDNTSIYVPDIGAGTTTISIGYVYSDNANNTNNATAWASAATNIQSGGYVALTAGAAGLNFVSTADGWVVATINTAATDATGSISFQAIAAYDGLGVGNSNSQA